MQIYCTEQFLEEYKKLTAKKQYATLQADLIGYFFNKSLDELRTGTNLNNSMETPYLKKRIKGSGGFRFYFLLIVKNKKLYLMFVHPKTGPHGASNITDESKALIYKNVLRDIKENNLYRVKTGSSGKKLLFKKTGYQKKKN